MSTRLDALSLPATKRLSWDRLRWQLVAAVVFGVALPFAIGAAALGDWRAEPPVPFTIALALAAVLTGLVFYRALTRYPGVSSAVYITPATALPYAIAAALLLIMREEYSRTILLSSAILSTALFHVFFTLQRSARTPRMAVVPIGDTAALRESEGVEWTMIPFPGAVPTPAPEAIVADLRTDIPDEWDRALADYVLAGIPVFDAKLLRESLTGRVEIHHPSENSFGALAPLTPYLKARALADKITAAFALVFLAPLFLAVALLIRLDTSGPVFFRQLRTGYRGKPFKVVKFRTMRNDRGRSDDLASAITRDGDTRITVTGKFLRRTRIDELPQIVNILRGEMSWIGPRPEAIALSDWYENEIAFYRYRHVVPPGITGWAQVKLGHVAEIDEVRLKLEYDFYYIKHFSFWLDFLIVLKTIATVKSGFGAR